mgnify:CR=1 FL=1
MNGSHRKMGRRPVLSKSVPSAAPGKRAQKKTPKFVMANRVAEMHGGK